MNIEGAIIKEQGQTFGVVVVKPHVLNSPTQRDQLVRQASAAFGSIPTVLMAQDRNGRPSYYGRTDIAKFLASVPFEAIPWKQYRLTGA